MGRPAPSNDEGIKLFRTAFRSACSFADCWPFCINISAQIGFDIDGRTRWSNVVSLCGRTAEGIASCQYASGQVESLRQTSDRCSWLGGLDSPLASHVAMQFQHFGRHVVL